MQDCRTPSLSLSTVCLYFNTWSIGWGMSLWNSLNSEKFINKSISCKTFMVYRSVVGLQRTRREHLNSLCPLPLWDCARVQALCALVVLYYITVALLLNAVGKYLEHQTQPAIHGLQMRPNEDGSQRVSL